MSEDHDEFLPTRQSLLSRLKDWGDDASWREFFDLYWRLVYRVAIKAGLNDSEAQEVVQETVLSVAKKIKDGQGFKYDPSKSFKGWLLQRTHWHIKDHQRRHQRQPPMVPIQDDAEAQGVSEA